MLNHRKWQEMRLRVLERADFKCEIRGCDYPDDETNPLHVHHQYYDIENKRLEPWGYPRGSLQCLCAKHHREVHEVQKKHMNKVQIPHQLDEDDIGENVDEELEAKNAAWRASVREIYQGENKTIKPGRTTPSAEWCEANLGKKTWRNEDEDIWGNQQIDPDDLLKNLRAKKNES